MTAHERGGCPGPAEDNDGERKRGYVSARRGEGPVPWGEDRKGLLRGDNDLEMRKAIPREREKRFHFLKGEKTLKGEVLQKKRHIRREENGGARSRGECDLRAVKERKTPHKKGGRKGGLYSLTGKEDPRR